MEYGWFGRRLRVALFLALAGVLLAQGVAGADRIPRIMFVGDSWCGFMFGFRSIKKALDDPEFASDGLSRWIETGASTAIMGAKAYEYLWPQRRQDVIDALQALPTVDIVVMTLGGNDFSGSFPVTFPGGYVREVDWYDWYRENHDGDPNNDWPESILHNQFKNDMRQIIQYILGVRPDIKIALCGYDFTCRRVNDRCNGLLTIPEQTGGLVRFEQVKRELAEEFPGRVIYVQTAGLMQHHFGYFTSNEWGTGTSGPWPAPRSLSEVDVPPGVAPLPGDHRNGYTPWPGGDPNWQDPRAAYIDDDIHLVEEGYDVFAKHIVRTIVREWLNYPRALYILPQAPSGNTQQFRVIFSHPVTGVDVTDFSATAAKAVSVQSVTQGSTAEEWVVTVALNGALEAQLQVEDDDTIVRSDDNTLPLGGPGVGNGVYAYNGEWTFTDLLRPADDDFVGSLEYLNTVMEPYIKTFVPDISFAPDRFDVNGNFVMDGGSMQEPYKIPGNAVLESYEFGLIRYCLDHPTIDLSGRGGLKAADVVAAWQNNIVKAQACLGGLGSIADSFLPGLDTLVAGYYTLGDGDSTFFATTLLTLLAAIDNFPVGVTAPDPADFIGFPDLLSRTADADKDGWTNEQEYAYFYPDGIEAYAAAALDPSRQPRRGVGMYEEGEHVRLALLDHPAYDSTFQWYRDGVALAAKSMNAGVNERCLDLFPVTEADAGSYTCVYQVGQGVGVNRVLVNRTYGPIQIRVGATIPAASGLGLLALGGVLAAVATRRARGSR
ncbi:MAG TPA: immunoglobulin domain-containing protein [Candidatus Hydrogenedentes bacterium]|nr:immunoglobulin domain-containing protein [Candidatus Hydrogenedentota bacterium]HOK89323.1 immunoglobulin domain-containing protein [Candidatus Hydrogenedentota bacterium]